MQERCPEWAGRGECGLNPNYMMRACKLSCGLCKVRVTPDGLFQSHGVLACTDAGKVHASKVAWKALR